MEDPTEVAPRALSVAKTPAIAKVRASVVSRTSPAKKTATGLSPKSSAASRAGPRRPSGGQRSSAHRYTRSVVITWQKRPRIPAATGKASSGTPRRSIDASTAGYSIAR